MKTFIKSIFVVLCLSLVSIAASVFMLPNSELTCSAATSDNTHTVNIYSSDKKTILATYEVEDGQSLNDYEDNLLNNGDFAINSNGQSVYTSTSSTPTETVDDWYLRNYCRFLTQTNTFDALAIYTQFFQTVNISNKTKYIVSFSTNDILYTDNIYFRCNLYLNNTAVQSFDRKFTTTGYVSFVYDFTNYNFDSISFGFFNTVANNSISIDYVKVQQGIVATPYFSETYITKLFRQANNLNSSDIVYWSTANNTGQFDFDTPITEDINIYGYEDLEFNENANELEAEMTYQPSYYLLEKAIDNIEYIHYKGSFQFNVSIDTSKLTEPVKFLHILSYNNLFDFDTSNITNSDYTETKYKGCFSMSYIGNFDFPIINFYTTSTSPSSLNVFKIVMGSSFGIPMYNFYLQPYKGIVTFHFSPSSINSASSGFSFNSTSNYEGYTFYNGTDFNDMNSNTNYFLGIEELTNNSFLSTFYNLLAGENPSIYIPYSQGFFNDTDKYIRISMMTSSTATGYSYTGYNLYSSDLDDNMVFSTEFYLLFDDNASTGDFSDPLPENSYSFDGGFNFTQFDIVVRKPVARVDNSLVIFNFGYNNFLSSVTQTRYELRRGFNYYDVVYNGTLENSKMIVIDNEFVRNSLFDEYIFVSFLIDGTNTTTFDEKDGKIGTYLGFDFNFVYYTQPLIAGNASYDLMQYRPEYMDGTPSLIPFNIPFTAWIYNSFIFMIFDCPLVSDLLDFLHLDMFLGALINLLDFYVNSPIGEFLMACLSFVLFWIVLKSLMPSALSDLVTSVNNNYEERELLRNETNKLYSRNKKISSFKGRKGKVKFAYKPNAAKRYKMRNMVYKKSNKE